jgi:hypothetical protein
MNKLQIERIRDALQAFNLKNLFVDELGWSNPKTHRTLDITVNNEQWPCKVIAELSGVSVFVVESIPNKKIREEIQKQLSNTTYENLVIFLDRPFESIEGEPTQSLWMWVKRDGKKRLPREHLYVKGQPGDLFISKISGIIVDINEFDTQGNFPLTQLTDRIRSALDVERVTKKFFREYDDTRLEFVKLISGIPDDKARRWYASILMNRLMFIWFLQRKLFLDNQNRDYLLNKLRESNARGSNLFYSHFLQVLFFEGFAKPAEDRSAETNQLLGDIRYLNGGLFIPHKLEQVYQGCISIPDTAFENLFDLFGRYNWNLNDTIGGKDDEINPDVLGYIFEKYINQKAFGAYYTRPEITEYLCERTIHRLILEKMNTLPASNPPTVAARKFHTLPDLLMNLDAELCRALLNNVLPNLKLLDPACGSGAFLVAAMKSLINVYSAVIGRIKFLNDKPLSAQLKQWETEHKSIAYFIKRSIITDNLFGVDIMEEATEIAKLRLFLALVASAQTVDQLEPLPNIDFNILAGNSLIGLIQFDLLAAAPTEAPVSAEVNIPQASLFDDAALSGAFGNSTSQRKTQVLLDIQAKEFVDLLEEKRKSIQLFKAHAQQKEDVQGLDQSVRILQLKEHIEEVRAKGNQRLNQLLLNQMQQLGIKFEEATWDASKNKEGKPNKRLLTLDDIATLQPFHWGFEFDEIINRGGFDAIITNPPWEIVKPQAKEFFQEYSGLVSKNKMTIKEFEKEQDNLLKDSEIRTAWLEYLSRFPHVSSWYRSASQFTYQTAVVNGKKTGSDINLYKLFTEQSINLLREGGECGIVIPSGIYTDLGAKGLRDLLFDHNTVTGLFCFENRKEIFEGVHRSFKFVVLTLEKGGVTKQFPAAFMRHEVSDLFGFPEDKSGLPLSIELIRRLSPDSHSVMEFKSELDIHIAENMLQFPLLGEEIEGGWNLRLTREFDMTNDSHLFKTEAVEGRLPLYEGKMIWHFDAKFSQERYFMDEEETVNDLRISRIRALRQQLKRLGLNEVQLDEFILSSKIKLDYSCYRFAFRDIASSTNERCMICAILPPKVFAGNTLNLLQPWVISIKPDGSWEQVQVLNGATLLYVTAIFDSFPVDWMLRQKITSHLNMFYVYQIPIPRITQGNKFFKKIMFRSARLTCTSPEFDELAKEIGLKSHRDGANDPIERARLRAELDGLIAHLYGLSESEFAHILATFPLVPEPTKIAALNAYRDVERGLIQ